MSIYHILVAMGAPQELLDIFDRNEFISLHDYWHNTYPSVGDRLTLCDHLKVDYATVTLALCTLVEELFGEYPLTTSHAHALGGIRKYCQDPTQENWDKTHIALTQVRHDIYHLYHEDSDPLGEAILLIPEIPERHRIGRSLREAMCRHDPEVITAKHELQQAEKEKAIHPLSPLRVRDRRKAAQRRLEEARSKAAQGLRFALSELFLAQVPYPLVEKAFKSISWNTPSE